jgi:hypothetical protein
MASFPLALVFGTRVGIIQAERIKGIFQGGVTGRISLKYSLEDGVACELVDHIFQSILQPRYFFRLFGFKDGHGFPFPALASISTSSRSSIAALLNLNHRQPETLRPGRDHLPSLDHRKRRHHLPLAAGESDETDLDHFIRPAGRAERIGVGGQSPYTFSG